MVRPALRLVKLGRLNKLERSSLARLRSSACLLYTSNRNASPKLHVSPFTERLSTARSWSGLESAPHAE